MLVPVVTFGNVREPEIVVAEVLGVAVEVVSQIGPEEAPPQMISSFAKFVVCPQPLPMITLLLPDVRPVEPAPTPSNIPLRPPSPHPLHKNHPTSPAGTADPQRPGAGRKPVGKLRKTVKLSPGAVRRFQAFARRRKLPRECLPDALLQLLQPKAVAKLLQA